MHAGSTVQLKWLGVWYEGFVVKIGPKKNLYRVSEPYVVVKKNCLSPVQCKIHTVDLGSSALS